MMKLMKTQKGLSGYEILVFLIMLGMLLLFTFKVAPMYYDYYLLDEVLKTVVKDKKLPVCDGPEIKKTISSRLRVNNIRTWDSKSLKIKFDNNDECYFDLKYESRANLAGNIDVVVLFAKEYKQ